MRHSGVPRPPADQSGQSMTEYIIVLVSVAVVVLVIGVAFGGRIKGYFMGADESMSHLSGEGREITSSQLNASKENSLQGRGNDGETRVTVDSDGNASGGGAHRGKSVSMGGAEAEGGGQGGGGFPIKEIILLALLVVVVMGGARAVAGGAKK